MVDPFANAEVPNPIAEEDFRAQLKRESAEICAYCNSVRSDFIVIDARGKRKIVKEKEKCTHCQ